MTQAQTPTPLAVDRDEGEAIWWFGSLAVIKASAAATGGAMSLIEITVPPNLEGPLHVHHREEEGFYRNINEGHRKHFAAMDVPVGSVGIAASQRSYVVDALAPYHSALDLPIARLLIDQDATSLTAAAIAAAP